MESLKNKIVCGDCIEVLSQMAEPFADLIFADPPFNIGYKYDKYNDKKNRQSYIDWTKDWISACIKVLKPHGSFYIAIGDEYAADVKLIAEELGLFMRNWIIWHYSFGQQMRNKFSRSHTHIFYFVKDKKNFTFNDHAVRIPSDRQLIYDDRRANPAGKVPDDVWDQFSRVCGTFRERTGWHPCQMPVGLLKRIIAVSSNPEELVLDPFIGSGTTAAAAYEMGRYYFGIDISESYVNKARERLKNLKCKYCCDGPSKRYELSELERLLSDIGVLPGQVVSNAKLLGVVTNQFNVRMQTRAKYRAEDIVKMAQQLIHPPEQPTYVQTTSLLFD